MADKTKQSPEMENLPEEENGTTEKATSTDSGSEAQLAALEQKLTEAEEHSAALNERMMRTAAEYENYRKRSQKEFESAFGNGVSHAAFELLVVLDTLDAAANTETEDEEYKRGVLLTLAKCQEVFKKLGILEIEALGQPFNPELHNAVMQDEGEDAESGTITKVMQKGYVMHDKVVRYAMVAVAP